MRVARCLSDRRLDRNEVLLPEPAANATVAIPCRTCLKPRIKSSEDSPFPRFDHDQTIFNPDFRLPSLQPNTPMLPHSLLPISIHPASQTILPRHSYTP